MRFGLPVLAVMVLTLASCVADRAAEPVGPGDQVSEIRARLCDGTTPEVCEQRLNALAEIDLADCADKSGEIVMDGLLGMPHCREPYPDAGKTCHDSDDCAGLCITSSGSDAKPVCQAYTPLFGCYAAYEDGEAEYEICVD